MLKSAPTLVEATPMGYDILKALARELLYKVRTSEEHACYVMTKKYGHLYATDAIRTIISEGQADEISERLYISRVRRSRKKELIISQPRLMAI
jgi:hypothetical protein